MFEHHEDLRSEDFAPARDLANMLSVLEKKEASRKEPFLKWLLKLLPDIKREELSHEVQARLMTAITQGEPTDKKRDFQTDGHVELGDSLLLLVEAKPEIGEQSFS